MKKKLFTFFDGLLSVFLLLMLVLNFYNILQRNVMNNDMPKIMGYGYAVVISGSMEPEISVKDIVYLKEQDSYAVGDIITYEKYGSLITHRIIDTVDGEYITKGDSNNAPDNDTVMMEQIKGKVVYVLPAFGAIVLYMKTPIGTLVTLLIALICLEVPYRIRLSKARKKGKKKYKRIARDMERIQDEIKKLDEEAAANPEMPKQQMVVDDPELQYQTFLEQMLQAESINDIRLPGGLAPAKPLEGEVVIGGSTEADDDYINRVAAKNAREKVEAERAALLAQGYTFASTANGADSAYGADYGAGVNDVVTDANAAYEADTQADMPVAFEETVAPALPAELAPGSAMVAMMSIASAMNTDFNLTYEDFEKGNEELLKLEAELSGVPYEASEIEDPALYEESVETPAEYAEQSEESYADSESENTEYTEAPQIDEAELARLRRIAEIEAELAGVPYEESEIVAPLVEYEYAEQVEETPVEYSPEEIVEYAEAAEEYAETAPEEEVSNEQFAVTDFVPDEPQGYAAAGGYVIDDDELARLRRIAEIEAELYGTEYVDPLESMQGVQGVTDDAIPVDSTVSDEYAEIMAEEYVPDTLVGYEAAEYVEQDAMPEEQVALVSEEVVEQSLEETVSDPESVYEASAEEIPEEVVLLEEEELARQRRIAEIEAELAGVPYVAYESAGVDLNGENEVDPEEAARLARIAEIEAELAGSPEVSPKKRAMMEAREDRKHKRAVDRHRRKGPPVYIPEEGVWNIAVDEYSLEEVLGNNE